MMPFFLYACVTTKPSRQTVSEPAIPQMEAPPRFLANLDEAAPDVKLVLGFLAGQLRGRGEPFDGIFLDPSGDNQIIPEDFLNQGFSLSMIEIAGFQAKKINDERAEAFIEGYFQFNDMIGRMISYYFAAVYSLTPEKLTLHSSSAIPMPSLSPVLETYFVPVSAFESVPLEDFNSFLDLYLFAQLYAVPMQPTPEERQAYEARKNMSFMARLTKGTKKAVKDDYYIMVFCMSGLSPNASLEMKITKKETPAGKSLAEPVYLYWKNWRVLIAGANFDPHAQDKEFYTHVLYTLDPGSGKDPVLIGTFANQKNFEPPRSTSARFKVIKRRGTPVKPIKQEKEKNKDPLESGSIFLDPSQQTDARAIQEKLAQLGYYHMKVDGKFGKGSRKALEKFKIDYNLGHNGNWDLATQKVLFKKSE